MNNAAHHVLSGVPHSTQRIKQYPVPTLHSTATHHNGTKEEYNNEKKSMKRFNAVLKPNALQQISLT
jgi:hypothetical protein